MKLPTQSRQVDICLCTFRRPQVVETLRSLDAMTGLDDVQVRIIIADNDTEPSAKDLIAKTAADMSFPVHYVHAPHRNISIARNACLDATTAPWMAWVDDDEVVSTSWLSTLLETAETENCDVVFGPAIARYPDDAADVFTENDFHSNRVTRRNNVVFTGHTANALVRLDDDAFSALRFDLKLGRIGGEDTDYFYRLYLAGAKMGLSDSAAVYEKVAPNRLNMGWLTRRQFNAGVSFGNSIRRHRSEANATSLGKFHGIKAPAKMVFCMGMSLLFTPFSRIRRLKWCMRGVMHSGVIVGLLNLKGLQQY